MPPTYVASDGRTFYDQDTANAYETVIANREEGIKEIEKGDYSSAIGYFNTAIKWIRNTYYKEMDCYIRRGEAYYRNGEFNNAISDFEYALEKELYAKLHSRNWLAIVSNDSGNYDNSIFYCTEAIAYAQDNAQEIGSNGNSDLLNNQFARAYCNRGFAYHRQGDQTSANEDYKIAADYGSAKALDNLKDNGINYSPTKRDLYEETRPATNYSQSNSPSYSSSYTPSYNDDGDTISLSDWDAPGCIATSIGIAFCWIPGAFVLILTVLFYPSLGTAGMFLSLGIGAIIWFVWFYLALGYEKYWHLIPQFLIVIYTICVMATGQLIPFLNKDSSFNIDLYQFIPEKNKTATTTDNVRFRSSPAVNDNNVISTIPKGTKVNVTGDEKNGWIPVEYNNKKGWVMKEYLK